MVTCSAEGVLRCQHQGHVSPAWRETGLRQHNGPRQRAQERAGGDNGWALPGEEGDRSFRDLCDLSEADSEAGSVSPRGPLSSPHAPRGSPTPTNTPDSHDLNMNAAGAAAELSAAAERFITQQLSAVPPELELRPSSTGVDGIMMRVAETRWRRGIVWRRIRSASPLMPPLEKTRRLW
ncbi:hypothetical protein E2C01_062001 [Portunus trituberculatus]|uniref:Uncharacterized protein n=1 Tax=Portunus trituberculatus TaxID=210409 RepID=A0A5B7HGU5_PORTR|nr:hypothetical protein [Portunus trituberculatus]